MKTYHCLECNYAITEAHREQAAFDYPCPNCGICDISNFYQPGSQHHKDILDGHFSQGFLHVISPPHWPEE